MAKAIKKNNYKPVPVNYDPMEWIDKLPELPLEDRIKTLIIMHDYHNWSNGEYKGNMHKVVPHIMELLKVKGVN